jgi:dihydrofolate reductase
MLKITMMMAVTADGKIAKSSNHFPDWTSKEDKKSFARISKEHGVVIMGEKTFKTFPAPLKDRLNVVFSLDKNPEDIPGVKWVTGEPEKVLEELEQTGYASAILGGGAYLNGLFLEKKLIDEMIINVEPKIFGEGLSLFRGDFDINLKLIGVEKINEDSVMLKYKVIY